MSVRVLLLLMVFHVPSALAAEAESALFPAVDGVFERNRTKSSIETGTLPPGLPRKRTEYRAALRELEDRREAVLKSISEQGKLTPELHAAIAAAPTKQELEDLYLPYKPKRRTKGMIAREAGIEPLAATHHAPGRGTQHLGRTLAQFVQKDFHDLLEADLLVVDHRGFEQQGAAQQALERAQQPAFGAAEVLGHGVAPEMRVAVFGVEEHRRGHGSGGALQRNQAGLAPWRRERHRRVGGAEINAQRAG